MSNLFWYILIGIISLGVCIYTIYTKRDKFRVSTLIVFYLLVTGITWIGEFIVLGLFNSYAYKTGLYENPWAQNLLGHLILNTSLYPTIAVVIVAYSLRYSWIAFFTALFVFMEYLFKRQGLYDQHWWRYYMTATVVFIYLSISKYWFSKLIQKPIGVIRTLSYYFVVMVIIHIPTPILLLMGKQYYKLDFINKLVGDFYLSSIIIAFVHHLFLSFVIVFFVCKLRKWYWKIAPFIISSLLLTTYAKMNILVSEAGWKFIYYLLIQQISILVFILIEKYTLKQDSIKN